jgi:hypothetical protein
LLNPGSNGLEIDLNLGYGWKAGPFDMYASVYRYIFPGSQRRSETDTTEYETGIAWKFISASLARDVHDDLTTAKLDLSYDFGYGISARTGYSHVHPDHGKSKTSWYARVKKSFLKGKYDIDLRYIDTNRNDSSYYDPAWIVTVGMNF